MGNFPGLFTKPTHTHHKRRHLAPDEQIGELNGVVENVLLGGQIHTGLGDVEDSLRLALDERLHLSGDGVAGEAGGQAEGERGRDGPGAAHQLGPVAVGRLALQLEVAERHVEASVEREAGHPKTNKRVIKCV